MVAATLWDEREGVALPCVEPLRTKLVRSFPRPGISIGPVDVEQHPPTGWNAVTLPLEALSRATADKWEEGIEPAHLLHELRDTGYEPAFSLIHLRERPLLATVGFATPAEPADKLLVALADRCFGAAFFRYLSLA